MLSTYYQQRAESYGVAERLSFVHATHLENHWFVLRTKQDIQEWVPIFLLCHFSHCCYYTIIRLFSILFSACLHVLQSSFVQLCFLLSPADVSHLCLSILLLMPTHLPPKRLTMVLFSLSFITVVSLTLFNKMH